MPGEFCGRSRWSHPPGGGWCDAGYISAPVRAAAKVQAFQELGTVRVVGVDEGNPLAASLIQALVTCRGNAGVPFVVEQADGDRGLPSRNSRITREERSGEPSTTSDSKVGVGLRQNGFNCGDDAISRVVDRHDDAGAR